MSDDTTEYGSGGPIDPVALLGSIGAPAGWNQRTDVTGPNADARAAGLLERIVTDNVVSLKRRNGLRVVTSIVVAVSLGGAAVAAVLWERSPEQVNTLSCWSGPMNPPAVQVGLAWDGTTPPTDRCAAAWASGGLGSDGPPPSLQACVMASGVTAVVPGDDEVCGTLGLARFVDPVTDPDADELFAVAELEERLISRFDAELCATPDAAEAAATSLIAELELEGWTVEVLDTFSAAEPCATVAVDSSVSTVFIVPVGPTG